MRNMILRIRISALRGTTPPCWPREFANQPRRSLAGPYRDSEPMIKTS